MIAFEPKSENKKLPIVREKSFNDTFVCLPVEFEGELLLELGSWRGPRVGGPFVMSSQGYPRPKGPTPTSLPDGKGKLVKVARAPDPAAPHPDSPSSHAKGHGSW